MKIQWKFDEGVGKLDENDIKVDILLALSNMTLTEDGKSCRWDEMSFNYVNPHAQLCICIRRIQQVWKAHLAST